MQKVLIVPPRFIRRGVQAYCVLIRVATLRGGSRQRERCDSLPKNSLNMKDCQDVSMPGLIERCVEATRAIRKTNPNVKILC